MQPQRDPPTLDEVTGFRRRFLPLLELGRGGMARVFLAESLASGIRKLVVLKVLNPELSVDAGMRAAFQREAEVSARMNHPNVVQVFEVVEQAGQPVIVMEYLDGLSLARVLQKAVLPLGLHLDILSQVLAGLHHFHELKDLDQSPLRAVHRDISPQNVLVLHDGIAKVVDFGIAKIDAAGHDQTRTGLIKGKIHYMPPEQLLGEGAVDRRADIFAVGVMMWEAIAGRRMWRGITEQKVLRALARAELPPLRDAVPDVPKELEAVVARSLAPDREDRFSTAEEMQSALERAIAVTTGVVHPRELASFMQRHFGEHREHQKKSLDEARRNPRPDNGVLEYASPSIFPAGQTASVLTEVDEPRASLSPPLHRGSFSRKAWLALALLVITASAALVFAIRKRTPPAPTETAQPSKNPIEKQVQKQIRIQVLTEPARAEIFLDGKRLGNGSYKGTHPASSHAHRLETRAAGYQTRDEWVNLDEDLIRLIRLDRLPPGARNPFASLNHERARGARAETQGEAEPSAPPESSAAASSETDEAALTPEAATSSVAASAPSAAPETTESLPADVSTHPVPPVPSVPSVPSAPSPPKPPAPLQPTAPSNDRPRHVASKIGHARLAVDSNADPFRVRLPPALERMGRSFEASVNICVSVAGAVSSVKIVRSADPALDRQLSSTIQRWRYRPLIESEKPIPFCYSLRFELSGR